MHNCGLSSEVVIPRTKLRCRRWPCSVSFALCAHAVLLETSGSLNFHCSLSCWDQVTSFFKVAFTCKLPNFRKYCLTSFIWATIENNNTGFSNMWVISKVLHTVRFLFKDVFILQNTFTGLQCNSHCALSQRSNVWASLVFLSGRLRCWCVWLLGSPY